MSIAKTQTSESFRLSALLSFSGGLQDAYTYNVRDGVFANAQTGKGSRYKALHFFGIILIFAIGAGIGGVLSIRLGIGTIWISPAILFVVALMMVRE